MAACSNPEYDGRTDTVYSLSTPSVTAKAYPGVNIVSWKPVSGAKSYRVCAYEEGALKWNSVSNVDECFYFSDTDLVNGKNYKYTVEAVSEDGLPAREVYVTNSSLGEASAKAIVPPAGTSALALAAYEKGYDGNPKEVGDDKFVISKENVEVYVKDGNVVVNFPTKTYLSYEVCLYNNNLPIEAVSSTEDRDVSDSFSNNVTRTAWLWCKSAGKYKVVVKVYACNGIYKDDVVDVKEITIDTLGLDDGTGSVFATYLSDDKTARISFTPAKKDGAYVPTSWYKVYRRVQGEYATTEIGSVSQLLKESLYEQDKYFVDDTTITDTKKAYEYIVVVGNDGKYGKAETATLKAETSLSSNLNATNQNAVYLYTDHFSSKANNTVRISFTPAKKDGAYVPTSWYKVYRSVDGDQKNTEVTSATNKVTATVNIQNSSVVYYVTDTIDDPTISYRYYIYAENDGKYGEPVSTPLNSKSASTINFYVSGLQKSHYKDPDNGDYSVVHENSVDWNIDIYADGLKKDEIKSITLYQVNGRNSGAPLFADEATTNVNLANVSGTSAPYEVSTSVDLVDGSEVYLVVKAERDGYAVTYKSGSVTIQK